jgi:FMN phosphatase YigB (HAD superfamily)
MKKIYSLLLFTSIFCTIILTTETTNKKPIIISDYDDVWNMKTFFLNLLAQLKSDESFEKKQSSLDNLTLKILDYGRRYPIFAGYTPWFIEYIGKARYVNQPIHDLYKQLQEEGYHIMIATNKDHLLYDLSLEALGNEISNIVDKVFVSEPASDEDAIAQLQAFADKPTTPANFRNMFNKVLTIQETENIIHIPSRKPNLEYFKYMIDQIGPDNDMIFIDDLKENVDAFNALQKDSSYLRRGIVYDQSNLQQFTQELTQLGLVSEMRDKKLLDDIAYPGMWGKIKLGFKSLFESKNTQAKTAE